MKQSKFPPGWDEERVRRVLEHYEAQTDEEAVAEDEGTWEDPRGWRIDHRPGTLLLRGLRHAAGRGREECRHQSVRSQ